MVARLNSFPPNRFVLRSKQGRPYYIYADPSGCGCAYVGTVAAMDKYRASFGALPADTLSSGGFTNPEQNMIDSMEKDDAGAEFAGMYLVRISRGVGAALSMKRPQHIMGNRHSDDERPEVSSDKACAAASASSLLRTVRDAEKFLKSEVDNVQHQIDRVGRN